MNARWRLRPHDPTKMLELSRRSGLSPLVAQVLLNRGIDDPARAVAFLDARMGSLHDPELLPGAFEAADRLVQAVRSGRKIIIYGDYDVDGVCGTSILWSCLRLAGSRNVDYYIPHRVEEGYGVNAEALRRLATENPSALIVTVDCGISAVREAELAHELGVELIVTDHHTIGAELPQADVIVHPRLPGGPYPCGDLCGAGVAFKLAWQICKGFGDGKRASPHLRDFLVRAMGLVALATIADVVPLSDENRVMVRHGLAGLAGEPTVGLRALMEVSGCQTQRTAEYGDGRLRPRTADQCRRPARAGHDGRRDADYRRRCPGPADRCRARSLQRPPARDRAADPGRGPRDDRGRRRRRRPAARSSWPARTGIRASSASSPAGWPRSIIGRRSCWRTARRSHRARPGRSPASTCTRRSRIAPAPCSAFGGHAAAAGLKLAQREHRGLRPTLRGALSRTRSRPSSSSACS